MSDVVTLEREFLPPATPVADPACWTGEALQHSTVWQYRFSAEDLDDLEAALLAVNQQGLDIIAIGRREFPLPRLGKRLADIRRELFDGRGFVLLQGLPVAQHSRRDAAILYWGIGCHLGYPVSQNADGHLLGHVIDLGTKSPADVKAQAELPGAGGDAKVFVHPKYRGYNSNERLAYHVDFADIIGLCCLHPARSGGESFIVNSIALHNEILRTRPDLLKVLYQPFCIDRRGEIPAGAKPYFEMPVFHYFHGRLTTYYSGGHIKSAGTSGVVPPMTAQQTEAMQLMDQLANDPRFRLEMTLEQGDLQFINNHTVLHTRTAFEDFDEPERRRHLLRLWLVAPESRPLPHWFYERYGAGRRGGIYVPGVREHVPLDPEHARNA